jgi:hypothetical protein
MTDCLLCEAQILDTAYACTRCADGTARALHAGAELYPELAVAIARQTRFGEPTRLSTAEQPLPFSIAASIDYGTIVNTTTTWARHITETRGDTPPGTGANLMHWLGNRKQIDWLRYRQEAGEALDELAYAARLVVRAVDAPAVHWFAGRCLQEGCQGELYGRTGARVIRCRECGFAHDGDARRAWLLDLAQDYLGTAAEIARLASAMRGDMVTTAMVRGYEHRGRLVAHGIDRDGVKTYRVGDVLAVLRDGRVAA